MSLLNGDKIFHFLMQVYSDKCTMLLLNVLQIVKLSLMICFSIE